MYRSVRPLAPAGRRIGAMSRPSPLVMVASATPTIAAATTLGIRSQPGVRNISKSYLDKKDQAAKEFAERARKITVGEIQNVWDVFEERGLIKDVAGRAPTIKELLRVKRIGAYTGFDPTAHSLHVGHLVALMPLFWLYFHGYPTVSLIGGATARIGDPTGRLNSRPQLTNSEISRNITKIHYQLERIWNNVEDLGRKYGYPGHWAGRHYLWNNNMWLNKLTFYDLLKRVGRDLRIGPMLAKETVKNKLQNGDGMSFAEFSYPIMQGWDFWHMYSKIGVQLQIGGSDQFGNITSGCEILKTCRETEEIPHARLPSGWLNDPYGFTTPILTDSAGNKFGKSAGNAVWLDALETAPFDFYGYFVSRSDEEVQTMLRMLTFMPLPVIEELMDRHETNRAARLAQHTLAFELTSLVHGPEVAIREQRQHHALFGREPIVMPPGTIPKNLERKVGAGEEVEANPNSSNFAQQVSLQLPAELIMGKSIARIVYAAGLCESASAAARLIHNGGLYVAAAPGQKQALIPGSLDWTPVSNWFPTDTLKFLIDGKLLILRRGKRNIRIIEVVDDQTWRDSKQTYPGEPGTGKLRMVLESMRTEAQEKGETLSTTKLRKRLVEQMASQGKSSMKPEVRVANNETIEFPPERGEDRWMTATKKRQKGSKEMEDDE